MPVKYGIMAYDSIPFFPKSGFSFSFDQTARLVIEPVKDTLQQSDSRHWDKWIGSLGWEEFSRGEVQIQVWQETQTPNVVDQENQDIVARLYRYSKVLMLCGLLRPPFNRPRFITGQAQLKDNKLIPMDIRTTGRGPKWIRPQYLDLDSYVQSEQWKAIAGQAPGHYGDKFFESWKVIYNQLLPIESDFQGHFLLNLSIYAFQQALAEPVLDFSFPNLVRSVETLVALSAGQGRSFFARRAKQFLPQTEELAFPLDDAKISKILKQSYGIRSDCVHGKPFAWSMGSKREKFIKEEAPIYTYVIEELARHTIRTAIANPIFTEATQDRTVLENYWNDLDPPSVVSLCPTCLQPKPSKI